MEKNTIITEIDSTYFNYEKGPLSLNKTWIIKNENIDYETDFHFILFSDNRNLNQKIYKFITNSTAVSNSVIIPIFVPINIKSSLIGDFYIRVEEE